MENNAGGQPQLVMRDGKCLVVRDRGRKNYSLPGGAIERGEPALAAAAREVYEETRLEPEAARLLFRHRWGDATSPCRPRGHAPRDGSVAAKGTGRLPLVGRKG